jgi:hypothetical protein
MRTYLNSLEEEGGLMFRLDTDSVISSHLTSAALAGSCAQLGILPSLRSSQHSAGKRKNRLGSTHWGQLSTRQAAATGSCARRCRCICATRLRNRA